jgi:predicted nucleotidyltransferase
MLDINEKHLALVKDILSKNLPGCEVRAFGSRVNGGPKKYSDLDLAVVCKGKMDRGLLSRLKQAFEESDIPFRVEVLDWHRISPSFRKIIENKYEVIQAPN